MGLSILIHFGAFSFTRLVLRDPCALLLLLLLSAACESLSDSGDGDQSSDSMRSCEMPRAISIPSLPLGELLAAAADDDDDDPADSCLRATGAGLSLPLILPPVFPLLVLLLLVLPTLAVSLYQRYVWGDTSAALPSAVVTRWKPPPAASALPYVTSSAPMYS